MINFSNKQILQEVGFLPLLGLAGLGTAGTVGYNAITNPQDNTVYNPADKSFFNNWISTPIRSLGNKLSAVLPGRIGDSNEANAIYNSIGNLKDQHQLRLNNVNHKIDELTNKIYAGDRNGLELGKANANEVGLVNRYKDELNRLMKEKESLEGKVSSWNSLYDERRNYRGDPLRLQAKMQDIMNGEHGSKEMLQLQGQMRNIQSKIDDLPSGPEYNKLRSQYQGQLNTLYRNHAIIGQQATRLYNGEISQEDFQKHATALASGKPYTVPGTNNPSVVSNSIFTNPWAIGATGLGASALAAGGVYAYLKNKKAKEQAALQNSNPNLIAIPQNSQLSPTVVK